MMRLAPVEGEFWIVEADTGTDEQDYYGSFSSEQAAHDWANARSVDCMIIHVPSPAHREREEQEEREELEEDEDE